MPVYRDGGASSNPNLLGRLAAKKFTTKRGRELLKRNQQIDWTEVHEIAEALRRTTRTSPSRFARCSSARPSPAFAASATASCRRPASLVEIGDAVGIIAAQSIGEPGTQLTMRTFHTGGVAGLDITQGLPRVVELFEARKPKGLAQIAEVAGKVTVEETDKAVKLTITDDKGEEHAYSFPPRTNILVEPRQARRGRRPSSTRARSTRPRSSRSAGRTDTEVYIVAEVQRVYRTQGVDINDKHIELIVRQMLKKVRVESKGSTELLPGQLEDRLVFNAINEKFKGKKTKTPARAEEVILGITKASLATESFLSAASFQETTKVLTDAALEGKRDRLIGLKENVIIGKLIPAATGLKHYRSLQIEPVEPAQPPAEELLRGGARQAELDLAGDGEGGSQLEGFGPSFAEELEELASEIETPGSGDSGGESETPASSLPRSPASALGTMG